LLPVLFVLAVGCAMPQTIEAINVSRELADSTIAAVHAEADLTRAAIDGKTGEELAAIAAVAAEAKATALKAAAELDGKVDAAVEAEAARWDALTGKVSETVDAVGSGDLGGVGKSLLGALTLILAGSEWRKYQRDKKRESNGA